MACYPGGSMTNDNRILVRKRVVKHSGVFQRFVHSSILSRLYYSNVHCSPSPFVRIGLQLSAKTPSFLFTYNKSPPRDARILAVASIRVCDQSFPSVEFIRRLDHSFSVVCYFRQELFLRFVIPFVVELSMFQLGRHYFSCPRSFANSFCSVSSNFLLFCVATSSS